MKNLIAFVYLFWALIIPLQAQTLIVNTVSKLPFLSLEKDNAKANLIGFVGGKGLRNDEGRTKNFLGSQKEKFFKANFNYYLFPNPNSGKKAGYRYRASEKNVDRIKSLVEFLKNRNSLPTYLLGFSRGSVDVSSYAMRYPETIKGVVVISGVYSNSSRKGSDYSIDLIVGDEIPTPLLIVHHKGDDCMVSDPEEAASFFETVKAPKKKIVMISGGGQTGRECGPFHHHGYEGVEEKAVTAIITWLRE